MKSEMYEQIEDKSSKAVLDRITIICAVLTIIISAIILAGWYFNLFDLTRSNPIYKPMSPGSALLLIVSGCALLVYFYLPVNHNARKLAKVGVGLILAFDIIILVNFITGSGFDIERFFLAHPGTFNNIIIGRMSPISAISFVISDFALLLLLFSPGGKQHTKGIAANLASISLYIGIIVFIGYLYGTPFFGRTMIPTSLSTSIIIIIFSTSLMTAAGMEYLPLRLFIGDSVRARLMRSFIPVMIAYIVLEGILEIVFFQYSNENVLESSIIMIFFFFFGVIVTSRIAQTVGDDVDRKNLIQRERAADALRESESKFKAIFETVPEGLALIRRNDDLLIEANNGFLQMFGYAKEELIGKKIREQNIWFDPDDKDKMMEQLQSRDFAYGMEVKYRKKNGAISIGTYSAAKLLINNEPHLIISTRDISQRKRVEEELLRNRALLSSVVEGTSDVIYIKDLQGRYLLLNSAAQKVKGKIAAQMIGKDDTFLLPPEDAAVIINRDRKVMEAGSILTFEEVITSETGEMLTFLSTNGPLFDASGKPYGLFGVARNITDRKRAEKEREVAVINAQIEKNKSEAIIAALGDGIIIQDTNYKITYQNKIQTEIFGEHIGEYCYKVYENRDTICEDCPVKKTFLDGKVHKSERSVRINGKMSYYELTSSPLRDPSGKIIAGVKMVRDITDLKRSEVKLREGEQFLESIIESIQDGIGIIDKEMNIIKVNKTAETWYPHAVPIVGKKCYEAYHNRKERCELCPAQETFRTGNSSHKVVPKHGHGGKEVGWLEIYSYPLRDTTKGQMKGVIEYVRDITQRKIAEAERIQFIEREQKALVEVEASRKIDRMKSMFIASTSHELRTPLNSVIGFSSMLLEGYSGQLTPEQKEQIGIVNSSGKHLLTLINDIIDISKIEAGNINIEVSEFKLRPIVDEAISMLRVSLYEKKLDLNVNVQDIVIRSDRRRLFQCIVNLISNAIKYTEEGSVEITVKVINKNVNITVADTGIGIKTEDIPKLFGPFVRLQTKLTYKTSGTGLGLYLVKKIAKDFLSGDVEVNSEFGKGSTFTLCVPAELERKV